MIPRPSDPTGVPGWLVFAGSTVVALIVMIGLVLLLVLKIAVPEPYWVLVGVVGTAYFGAGPFSVAHSGVSATNRLLLDTVNHAIATLRDATTAASTTATTIATATSGHTTTTPGNDHPA